MPRPFWITGLNRQEATGTISVVLLTITTTRAPATDLGYCCTSTRAGCSRSRCRAARRTCSTPRRPAAVHGGAAARGRPGGAGARRGPGDGITHYVNDRPYAASSLLAVALKGAFGTALTGRCDARPELAAAAIPLEIRVPALRCNGGAELARGYSGRWAGGSARRRATRPAVVGHLGISGPAAGRDGAAGRRAQPPVRSAARARRREALLGVHRRGGQAGAGGRRVAGRAPGEGADHEAVPGAPAAADRVRAGAARGRRRPRPR